MGYKFREEHPPRQRLTLELGALLATFLVVIGVWTRTVVLGDPTPTPAAAIERHVAIAEPAVDLTRAGADNRQRKERRERHKFPR